MPKKVKKVVELNDYRPHEVVRADCPRCGERYSIVRPMDIPEGVWVKPIICDGCTELVIPGYYNE
jgi:hypothetical protein